EAGSGYEMLVEVPDHGADLLRAATGDVPEDVQTYHEVPETEHADDLRARAVEPTADAATAYEQALALEPSFRDGTQF
ncbi:hypothetical protein, partial [Cellulomonas sp. GbtcB1]|uniref:hypothetical protein n=1 Tax=Cellulomonas sp. GbtcB1 TaxID=2824746 RepID=UPI001C2F4FFF